MDPIRKFTGNGREIMRSAAPRTWRIRGKETVTGEPLALLYSGVPTHREYFIQRVFANGVEIEPLGRGWILSADRTARRFGCDLSIQTLRKELRFAARNSEAFYMPLWINATVDLRSFDSRPKPSTLKEDLRRIRRHGLTCVATRDPRQIMEFYDTMYLPYTLKRHGSNAPTQNRASLEGRAKTGSLEFISIYHQGSMVGGSVIDYSVNPPLLRILGAASTDLDILKTGVISASYLFAIRHLIDQGKRMLNVGLSRSFIRDGVLQYKRKLGAKLNMPSEMGAMIRPISKTDAVRSFLSANPFISSRKNKLWLLTFPTPQGRLLCDESSWLYHGRLFDGLAGVKEIKDLEQENAQRKQLAADPSVDQAILEDALKRNF
jgi:hypothetical protein